MAPGCRGCGDEGYNFADGWLAGTGGAERKNGNLGMTTAAIRRLAVPSPDELVERAGAMVPEIRALAEETERNRAISPHIIDQFREAELLRTCRPKEFG